MSRFLIALSALLLASPALAGTFSSGSDGLSGDLIVAPNEQRQIDLSLAIDGDALTTPGNGNGVYDATRWVVVFKYNTIDIQAGATVTFLNHPKGAPVVWLAAGNVTIAGQVRLDGADGSNAVDSSYAVPGPGGFSGGLRRLGLSHGFGPGGGSNHTNIGRGSGAGYGTAGVGTNGVVGGLGAGMIYGTASILPLIGGSGGSGSIISSRSGGAGGGAILIASSMDISLPNDLGGIFALGGNPSGNDAGGGSGGGIRLMANHISGSGLLQATAGTSSFSPGGKGRIRVEANTFALDDLGDPTFPIITAPGLIFPDVTTGTTLRVTAVNGVTVPDDPVATVRSGDICIIATGLVTIDILARNVPAGTAVTVRVVNAFGNTSQLATSSPLTPDGMGNLIATANVNFALGTSEVQLSVQP